MQQELWTPQAFRDTANFRKAPAPALGNAYGSWAGRDLRYLQMPGGAVMQFDLSKLTLQDYRQMRDNYQINASLSVLAFMMHQLDWHVESEDKKLAADCDTAIRNVWTELIHGFSQSYWSGFSPMVIDWANDGPSGKVVIDRIKDLVPEDCYVNWKIVEGATNPDYPNTAPPKFYEYDGIQQFAPGGFLTLGYQPPTSSVSPIPAQNTIWHALFLENGNYYGRKLLKPAFTSWFFSTLIHLFANRYFERFAEPTPIGRAPFDDTVTTADNRSISGREAMVEILSNLRSRGVVVLPSEKEQIGTTTQTEYTYDISFLESQMRGADFERYLNRLDEEMSLAVFTPLLLLRTGDVGSNALGVQHTQSYLWFLNAFAGDMKASIDNYVLKPLAEFNAGPNHKPVRWVARQLGKDNVETLRGIIDQLLRQREVGVDLDELGQAIGLTLHETELLQVPGPVPRTGGAGDVGYPGEIPPPGSQIAPPPANPPTPGPKIPGTPKPGGPPGRVAPRHKIAALDSAQLMQQQAAAAQQAKAAQDTRQGRPDKAKAASNVGKKISARVKAQVEKAEKAGRIAESHFDLGYHRQMEEIIDDSALVETFFRRVDTWLLEAASTNPSATDLLAMLERVLEGEVDELVGA